jgi:hypothetical protein
MSKIEVLGNEISLYSKNSQDYICITDIARSKSKYRKDDIIRN